MITAWTGQPCPPLDSITQPALMTQVGVSCKLVLVRASTWNHLALVLNHSQHGRQRKFGRLAEIGAGIQAIRRCCVIVLLTALTEATLSVQASRDVDGLLADMVPAAGESHSRSARQSWGPLAAYLAKVGSGISLAGSCKAQEADLVRLSLPEMPQILRQELHR